MKKEEKRKRGKEEKRKRGKEENRKREKEKNETAFVIDVLKSVLINWRQRSGSKSIAEFHTSGGIEPLFQQLSRHG